MNNYLTRRLSDVFSGLSVPFTLFDRHGRLLLGSVRDVIQPPLGLEPRHPVVRDGAMYIYLDVADGLLLMTPDAPLAQDSILMAAAMVETISNADDEERALDKAYRRLLEGEISRPEADALMDEFKIPREGARRVLLMSANDPSRRPAAQVLRGILPLDKGDILTSLGSHTAALIKMLPAENADGDVDELAAAMQETALSEEGVTLTIGIGDPAEDMRHISRSYAEARQALELGSVFSPGHAVHIYRNMLLERFLDIIPPEDASSFHRKLFNHKTARLFSEEMLDTINMFLEKDLNMADTARQMYIHRNTLVYRLEKVQKQTGLDLRRFKDAVTFKLFYEMAKCADLPRNK